MVDVVDYLKYSTSFNEVLELPNRISHKLFKEWRTEQDNLIKEVDERFREDRKPKNRPVGLGDLHQIREERERKQNSNG